MGIMNCSNTERCILSMRISTDGFVFAVSNPLDNRDEGWELENYPVDVTLPLALNLRQAFSQLKWLERPFRKVKVLLATKRFTLLPMEYFKDDCVEAFFYQNHSKEENEMVLYNTLSNSNAAVLFGIDRSVVEAVQELQPEAKFYAQVSPLIDHFAVKSRLSNTRKLYVHVRREYIDVLGYEAGRLLLVNAYKCGQQADCIYYILCIWQMLGFDQENDELYLLGGLDEKPDLLTGLKDFIRWVSVMEPAGNMDLQTVVLCE